MLKRLTLAAFAAGLSAGIAVLLVQGLWLLPLIDLAEFLESGGDLNAYAPPQGLFAIALMDPDRLLGTFTFDTLTGVAFALMVGAAMSVGVRGDIDWKSGLMWGLGGWAAFSLAPAIGQPPTPPGAAFVDLEARQIWWWLTVSTTAAGLALVVFGHRHKYKLGLWALGAVLLVLPHAVGAPGDGDGPLLAGDLARDFAAASIFSALVFWLVLGGVLGLMLRPSRKP
ncbi:MAG: CbtA family protein [Rhodospirillaceae bacterium]|nr:CbtA family protein [Rhodospirillaceae bacterium]